MSGNDPVGTIYNITSDRLEIVENIQITIYDLVVDRYTKWVDALALGSAGANSKGIKCKRLLTGISFTVQVTFLGK